MIETVFTYMGQKYKLSCIIRFCNNHCEEFRISKLYLEVPHLHTMSSINRCKTRCRKNKWVNKSKKYNQYADKNNQMTTLNM